MKQTKTTLKELTAAYRAVLRHGILCNAIALGLIAAVPAHAVVISENNMNLNTLFPDGVITEEGKAIDSTSEDGYTSSLTTETINITATGETGRGVDAWWGSNLTLGGADTTSVTVTGSQRGLSIFDPGTIVNVNASNSINVSGVAVGATVVGGSTLNMNANNINVSSEHLALSSTNSDTIINVGTTGTGEIITLSGAQETAGGDSSYASVSASKGGTINIGNGTQDITISGTEDITVWAVDHGGHININGDDVSISSTNGSAVWAQNNTLTDTNDIAQIDIAGNTVAITAENDNAVVAMSQGIVNIEGNTTLTGKNAILTRGNAQTHINADGDKTVVMNGDIDFNYNGPTSRTGVDALVDVVLNGTDSVWNGNTVVSYDYDVVYNPDDSIKRDTSPTVDKLVVTSSNITLQNGATWNASEITDVNEVITRADGGTATINGVEYEADLYSGRAYTALNNLTVNNGGTVNIADQTRGITVNNLVANGLTINGGNMTVDNTLTGNSILVNAGAGLTGTGTATFENGSTAYRGGAIYNKGTVALDDATFTGNTLAEYGGAIHNEGTFGVNNLTLSGNSAVHGGGIMNLNQFNVAGSSLFTGNTATSNNGGAVYNEGAMVFGDANNTNATTVFGGSSAQDKNTAQYGGAIYNSHEGDSGLAQATMTFNNAVTFENNVATVQGGAIVNGAGDTMTFNDAVTFKNNKAQQNGNIAFNSGTMIFKKGLTLQDNGSDRSGHGVNNSGFDNNNGIVSVYGGDITVTGNTAGSGAGFNGKVLLGAYTDGTQATGDDAVTNITFRNNHAVGNATGDYATAGALYAMGGTKLYAQNITFDGNTNSNLNNGWGYGGAVAIQGGTLDIIGSVANNFTNNHSYAVHTDEAEQFKFGGGAIQVRGNTGGTTLTIGTNESVNTFSGNTSAMHGGALHARSKASTDESTMNLYGATTFSANTAKLNGGAIYNYAKDGKANLTLTGSGTFENNMASGLGGAIYNTGVRGVTTINATTGNFTFSGNKSGVEFDNEGNVVADTGTANDIYNSGTLTLNAGAGNTISLTGGIDGETDGSTTGLVNITGAGTVSIANALKKQTVSVDDGSELHLTNADLTGSNVTVASGATLNTIDNLINDYMASVTLSDGAIIAGDIDYINGVADTYSAATGAEITYKLANALNLSGMQYGAAKEIQVTNTGATVNKDSGFLWANSVEGLSLTSGGAGTGTVIVEGQTGGLNAAVDFTDDGEQTVEYNLTAATETFDGNGGTDNTIQNATFTVTGNGNTEGSNTLVFGSNLVVDGDSELTLNDIVLDKVDDEEIQIAEGATVNINNSRVGVNLNNAGTLNSDPTIYGAEVVNSGTANFVDDIFESGSSLTNNSGTVNLTNVEFVQGSTVDGDGNGLINIQNGQTIFDTTVQNNALTMTSGANVVVGEHGSLNGVGITAAGGTINLNNGHIDTLGNLTANGNVGVSLDANFNSGEYDTISGMTGSGQLLINNINLLSSAYNDSDGYFSLSVVEDGTGSIDFAPDMTITGGTNYFTSVTTDGQNVTFGDKLMNASSIHALLGDWNGTIIGTSTAYDDETNSYSNTPGMTVGGALTALQTAVNSKQAAIVDSATIVANTSGGFDVAAGSIGATQLAANSVASSNIIDGTIVNADIAAGTITTDRLASQDVSQFNNDAGYQTASDVGSAITTALANSGNAYQTASDVGSAITTALANGTNAYQTASDVGSAITTALANGGDAYQTASQVSSSIETALANGGDAYQTASQVSSTVNNAITSALGSSGAVTGAIATATTMAADTDPDSSLYNNFDEGVSVISAVTSLDSAIGTTTTGTHVTASNSVGQNINALDSAIGTTTTGTHVTATASVGTNINALDSALATAESNINDNAAAIATLNGDEDTAGSVRNIAKSYFDLASQDNALTLSQANAYTDERIEKLDKDLSAGIASAVALSSVAVSDVRRGEMSVGAGYGYFNGQSAAAFGAAMGISNRWSVNAGAGVSGYDVSFRAGTNYKFKLF